MEEENTTVGRKQNILYRILLLLKYLMEFVDDKFGLIIIIIIILNS